jgi:hypothetical protein
MSARSGREDSMVVRSTILSAILICGTVSCAQEPAVPPAKSGAANAAEETITIPLREVWSTDQKYMASDDEPLTRYIGKLEEGNATGKVLLNEIRQELDSGSIQAKADPAFAVEGEDIEALKNAHAVLVGKQPRSTSLPKDSEKTIVFFSLYSPYYVTLTDVKRRGNTILIRYEYIPRADIVTSRYFSLIPLGKLLPGRYQVQIDHEPFEKRFRTFRKSGPNELVLGRVSPSFEFDVK